MVDHASVLYILGLYSTVTVYSIQGKILLYEIFKVKF